MLELIKDRAFLEHLAPYLGVSPRTVRKHLAAVAAGGHFDGLMSDWTPAICPCEACRKDRDDAEER